MILSFPSSMFSLLLPFSLFYFLKLYIYINFFWYYFILFFIYALFALFFYDTSPAIPEEENPFLYSYPYFYDNLFFSTFIFVILAD